MTGERYTHGHHRSVVESHARRSAVDSAAYLLPHLSPGQRVLDVGCGPGTITCDLARIVAPGAIIGIDREPGVIARAESHASDLGLGNVHFAVGDVYSLAFDDGSFDVVHAHQVLQHLTDPVRALREMRRVLCPGGLLAVRDVDYATMVHSPRTPAIDRWLELYHSLARHNGAEPDAGRELLGWVRAAGFDEATATTSTWTYSTREACSVWATTWADRVTQSAFAEQAVAAGLSTPEELAWIAEGWRSWGASDTPFFAMLHGEVLARVADGSRRAG